MRHKVAYKIIYAGHFKSAETTMEQAAEFMSTLEPPQIIAVNTTPEGQVIVWYRMR
jgi:hypothetical protein